MNINIAIESSNIEYTTIPCRIVCKVSVCNSEISCVLLSEYYTLFVASFSKNKLCCTFTLEKLKSNTPPSVVAMLLLNTLLVIDRVVFPNVGYSTTSDAAQCFVKHKDTIRKLHVIMVGTISIQDSTTSGRIVAEIAVR